MKYYLIVLISLTYVTPLLSQSYASKVKDSLYKEDQFYIGTTYNVLINKPSDLKQTGFSLGFHLGIIKDIPLNKQRNVAIGIGLGYSTNSYNQNLLINRDAQDDFNFSILGEEQDDFSRNKFSEHVLELPIEFRWRTSTASTYKFWRVYVGAKLGYVFNNRSKFEGDSEDFSFSDIDNYNKFQYGPTLSLGYNTWNIYAYYGLNSIFSNARLQGEGAVLNVSTLKLGLLFYIL